MFALFAGGACSKHESGAAEARQAQLPVVKASVVEAKGVDLPVRIQVTGVVRASERAQLAPKVMGSIRSMSVDLGQAVTAGDLLVKIEAAEISARVLQARTQLAQANRDLEREQSLLEKEASTSEMVKNLGDRVTIMEAMVDEATAMLSYTEIRAPFDGTVSQLFADEGSLSAPGMPLLELQGQGGFEIEAAVPESLVGGLLIGSDYLVTVPSTQGRFMATLTEVSSGFDVSSRSVAARFVLPLDAPVRAGQFARLSLSGPSRPVISVPESAVSKRGQMERVFVESDGAAVLRLVKTGMAFEGQIEVVSGLDAGERVLVGPAKEWVDGQPLEVVN